MTSIRQIQLMSDINQQKLQMIENYYECLQLTPKASSADIAQNYRKLALRYHPKSTKQSPQVAQKMFDALAEAYEVLSDPIKRAFFDKNGYEALKQGLYGSGALKGGYRYGNNAEEIYQNFFKNSTELNKVLDVSVQPQGGLFGNAFGGLNYKDTQDWGNLIVKVPCTLEELYRGASKCVNYNKKTLNRDGRTTTMEMCTKTIHIKPGYSCKNVLHFPKEGHQTVHGTVSDLIFCIEEVPHFNFVRKGDDLVYTQIVTLADAFACPSVSLKTLDGRIIEVAVDEIVSPRSLRQVQGEGMTNCETGKRGNLFIRFDVVFPVELSLEIRNELRTLL